MQKKQGFTLIELLVVIAIIGILSAIGLTALSGAQSKARDVKRKADLGALNASITLYTDAAGANFPLQEAELPLWTGSPAVLPTPATPNGQIVVVSQAASNGFAIPKAPAPYGTDDVGSYWYVTDGVLGTGTWTAPQTAPSMFALFTKLENKATGDTNGTWFVSNSKGFSDSVPQGSATTADPNAAATTTTCATTASGTYSPCLAQPVM